MGFLHIQQIHPILHPPEAHLRPAYTDIHHTILVFHGDATFLLKNLLFATYNGVGETIPFNWMYYHDNIFYIYIYTRTSRVYALFFP